MNWWGWSPDHGIETQAAQSHPTAASAPRRAVDPRSSSRASSPERGRGGRSGSGHAITGTLPRAPATHRGVVGESSPERAEQRAPRTPMHITPEVPSGAHYHARRRGRTGLDTVPRYRREAFAGPSANPPQVVECQSRPGEKPYLAAWCPSGACATISMYLRSHAAASLNGRTISAMPSWT